jgi:membrane protein YdbS with pleckstrin-like domain
MAISPRLLSDGESVVLSVRTHPKALVLPSLALILLLAIGITAQVEFGSAILRDLVWLLVLAGAIWFFVRPLLSWLAATYTITNHRLLTRHGILTRRGHDIPLTRISDVAYEMDLLDRILRCGTLRISDASTDGEVTLPDIPHVEEVQRTLNDLIQRTGGRTDR